MLAAQFDDDEPTQLTDVLVIDVQVATSALYRALVELQADHDRLAAALDPFDPVGLEIAASDLGCTWRATRLAYNALAAVTSASSAQSRIAKLGLRAGQRAVERLLTHALDRTRPAAGHRLALHDLVLRICSAM
jgi:hypothetical protein